MKMLHRLCLLVASAAFFIAPSFAQNTGTVPLYSVPLGLGAGKQGFGSVALGNGQILIGQTSAAPTTNTPSGDLTMSAAGAFTFNTVNSNVGSFGSATNCTTITVNAKGLITAASQTTCTPAVGSITGLGAGCATFLGTPSSANLRGCLTDEVGTGAAYFVGGALGTPASGSAANLTGLPTSGIAAIGAYTFVGNNTGSSATPTAVDIAALTTKGSPAATDYVMISDQAASGAWKKVQVSSLASAGSVSSIDSLTGSFTTSNGITSTGNSLQLTSARRTLPTTQVFLSASGTYNTPANVLWIEIEMCGGGAGGAGSGSTGATLGTGGGNTTFGALTANGGSAPAAQPTQGAGGTASGGYLNQNGGAGGNASGITTANPGGAGGISPFGGAGVSGAAGAGPGTAAATNSCSGGGGGGVNTTANGGGGGGAGGYLKAIINSPSASYAYAVGTAGSGGSAGTGGAAGGAGAAGRIMVIEHYGS